MIKINLLPDSIFEPARKKALLSGSLVLLAGLAVGMFFWGSSIAATKVQLTDERDTQQRAAQAVDAKEQQQKAIEASFAELKTKVQNVRDIYCHNLVYVKLYKTLADWTPSSYRYDSMVARSTTANLNVYTRKLDDVAYYLQSMQKCPAITPAGITLSMYSQTTAGGSAPSAGAATSSPGGMSSMMPMSPSGGSMMPMSPGGSTASASAPASTGSGLKGYVFPVTITLKSAIPAAPSGFGAPPASGTGGPGGVVGGAGGAGGGMGLMGSPTSAPTGQMAPGSMMMPRPPGSGGGASAGPSIPGGGPMKIPGR